MLQGRQPVIVHSSHGVAVFTTPGFDFDVFNAGGGLVDCLENERARISVNYIEPHDFW